MESANSVEIPAESEGIRGQDELNGELTAERRDEGLSLSLSLSVFPTSET